MRKTYSEMLQYPTLEERYNYLKCHKAVGSRTFGSERYLNQRLYTSPEWRRFRRDIIVRDYGCDLAVKGVEIPDHCGIIHHINPLTVEDVANVSDAIFDPENVVCCSRWMHDAIHYGDYRVDAKLEERRPGDTMLW